MDEAEDAWYALRSGTSGASRRGAEICMVRCWKAPVVVGTGPNLSTHNCGLKIAREVHRPVAKDLLTKPLEESWYPPAHLGGTSERPVWCASWARAERLSEGALGTPDASVRTVGGRVAYFFAACREVAAI